jgi:hypothetical protein
VRLETNRATGADISGMAPQLGARVVAYQRARVFRPGPQDRALAGRADLRDSRPQELLRPGRVGGVWHHPIDVPEGLPHGGPGAEPDHAHAGSIEGCPWAAVWSGCPRDAPPAAACKFCDLAATLRSLGGIGDPSVMSASRKCDRGLIFVLIRLRSSMFIGIRINAVMQARDVNGIRRTISRVLKISRLAVKP